MQRHFDEELSDLKKEILCMGSLVQDSIHKAVDALKEMSSEKAKQEIAEDRQVDELELKIEEKCLDLLALRQPMAADLRFIVMAMKMTTDLERIADLSVDIAQRVLELAGKPLLKPLTDIPKMTALCRQMIEDVINAFIKKDMELAKKVILTDSEVDALKHHIQTELIYEYMAKDPSTAPRAMPLLLASRHLERICDHLTNIAEDVIYIHTGRIVRHVRTA